MKVLVIAEHDNNRLNATTLNAVSAALQIGGEVDILVAGHQCAEVAEQAAQIVAVNRVLLADHAAYANHLAENMAALLADLGSGYSHLLATATSFGKNLLPRVAAMLDVQSVSDVNGIQSSDTFTRTIYAGNVIATVKSLDPIKVITVRATAFDIAAAEGGQAPVEILPVVHDLQLTAFIREQLVSSDRPKLTSADVVISGGRGMQSADNFELIYHIADKLNGAVGASRAAVDAGFAANDMQVGQTGKIVAPKLYVAVGISGAIQHLAGMKDSQVIVAINKDEEAPIFQVADYGLVADLFQALPELEQSL